MASTITLLLISIIVPISTLLIQERKVLSDRRMIGSLLHDELQKQIWMDGKLPKTFYKTKDSKSLKFDFLLEGELIKGCVSWENVRKSEEMFCLFGMPKK